MSRPRRLTTEQSLLPFEQAGKPKLAVAGFTPSYGTALGDAYWADARELLKAIPGGSVTAVVDYPP